MRRTKTISAWRALLAAVIMSPALAAASPLSAAGHRPDGDWLDASVAMENVEDERTFPGLGLHAALGRDWQAGIRLPVDNTRPASRWSDARRHGELLARRHFMLAPQLHGTATAGAAINSGETSQHPQLVTGSLLGVGVRHGLAPWRNTLGVSLQQFEPRRDGSRPGDIWSLHLMTGRFMQWLGGNWFAGASLDGELYLPGTDPVGAELEDGSIWFAGASLAVERRHWRLIGAMQAAVDDALPDTEAGADHRLQLQLSYGFGAGR